MTALYILIGILAVLLLLLLTNISFRVTYCQKVILQLKIGFFKLNFDQKDTQVSQDAPKKAKKAKPAKPKPDEPKRQPTLGELFELLRQTVTKLVRRFGRHARLERYVVKVNVASDEPDKTAVLYGTISAAAANLYRLVSTMKKHPHGDKLYSEVTPDFISEKFDIFADIAISLRVWHILHIGMTAITAYFTYKKLTKLKGK